MRTGELIASPHERGARRESRGADGCTPIRPGSGARVYLRDIGTVENGTDIVTGYAHVDGKRTVYIPVTKRADASHARRHQSGQSRRSPIFKKVVPEDVDVQPGVRPVAAMSTNAIRGLINEGVLGAVLTGLMVLLFLRDWRSALIVVTEYSVRAVVGSRAAVG